MPLGIFLLGVVGVASIPTSPFDASFVQIEDDPSGLMALSASLKDSSLLKGTGDDQTPSKPSFSLSAPPGTGAISLPATSASTVAATSPTASIASASLSDSELEEPSGVSKLSGTEPVLASAVAADASEEPASKANSSDVVSGSVLSADVANTRDSDVPPALLNNESLTSDADVVSSNKSLVVSAFEGVDLLPKNDSLATTDLSSDSVVRNDSLESLNTELNETSNETVGLTSSEASPDVGSIINNTVAATVAPPSVPTNFDDLLSKYLPAGSASSVSAFMGNGTNAVVVNQSVSEPATHNATLLEASGPQEQQQQQQTLVTASTNASVLDSGAPERVNTSSASVTALENATESALPAAGHPEVLGNASASVIVDSSNETVVNASNVTETKPVDHPDEIIGAAIDENATDTIPIFIIFRDSVGNLKKTIASIKAVIESPFQIVIHNLESSYPPAVEYLNTLKAEGIPVYHQSLNSLEARQLLNGTLEINADGVNEKLADQSILLVRRTIAQYRQEFGDFKYYVVTDANTALVENTPLDILWYFQHILETMPNVAVVAPGLKTDDIPDTNPDKAVILDMEANNTAHAVEVLWDDKPTNVHVAPIDTSFGMYRGNWEYRRHLAINSTNATWPTYRTTHPYEVRQLDWYIDYKNVSADQLWCWEHKLPISKWGSSKHYYEALWEAGNETESLKRNQTIALLHMRPVDESTEVMSHIKAVAFKLIKGDGLEVGALKDPAPVPRGVEVKQVLRKDLAALKQEYPVAAEKFVIDADIVDDTDVLSSVQNETQDFIIGCNYIQRTEDLIGTVKHHVDKLKEGGLLMYTTVNKNTGLDVERDMTSWQDILADEQDNGTSHREARYHSWALHVAHNTTDAEAEAHNLMALNSSHKINMLVWDFEHFSEIVHSLKEHINATHPVEVMVLDNIKDLEFIVVLKKLKAYNETLEIEKAVAAAVAAKNESKAANATQKRWAKQLAVATAIIGNAANQNASAPTMNNVTRLNSANTSNTSNSTNMTHSTPAAPTKSPMVEKKHFAPSWTWEAGSKLESKKKGKMEKPESVKNDTAQQEAVTSTETTPSPATSLDALGSISLAGVNVSSTDTMLESTNASKVDTETATGAEVESVPSSSSSILSGLNASMPTDAAGELDVMAKIRAGLGQTDSHASKSKASSAYAH